MVNVKKMFLLSSDIFQKVKIWRVKLGYNLIRCLYYEIILCFVIERDNFMLCQESGCMLIITVEYLTFKCYTGFISKICFVIFMQRTISACNFQVSVLKQPYRYTHCMFQLPFKDIQ